MERATQKVSCQKTIVNAINSQVCSLDAFGEPIGFNYKGAKTYQTFIGGIFTILARILILIYFSSKVVGIVKRATTITNTEAFIQTNIDTRHFYLDKNDFDYAIVILNNNQSYPKEDFDLYLNIRPEVTEYTFVNGELSYDYWELETELCAPDRLKNTSTFYYYQSQPVSVICQKNQSMTLFRSQNSLEATIQFVTISKCDQSFLDLKFPGQNKLCKSPEEISTFIETGEYMLLMMNQYFDTEEFEEDPIKPFGYSQGNSLFNGYTDYYYFQISENKAYVQDSWLQSYVGEKEHTYYQVNRPQQSVAQIEGAVAVFAFAVSEHVQTIERVRKNVIDSLSDTGGIIEIIFLFISFFLGSYESFRHNADMILHLFQVEEDHGSQQKPGQVASDVSNKKIAESQIEAHQVGDQTLLDNIMRMIKRRTQLIIGYHEIFFRHVLCLCKKRLKEKVKLYRKGEEKLESIFDIVEVVREVRNMTLVSQIILSKYQKTLIPYFQSHLIEADNSNEGDQVELSKSQKLLKTEQYLKQVILNSHQDKIDKKILKQLVLTKMEEQNKNTKSLQIAQYQFEKNLQSLWHGQATENQNNSYPSRRNQFQGEEISEDYKEDIYRFK